MTVVMAEFSGFYR
jgi:putative Ca2+/H+ antiporter (TMEM165/GDT1 family)